MICRGVRGATGVDVNEETVIVQATRDLLERIVTVNAIPVNDIVSVIFTVTPDLSAAYPARAARDLGWRLTPLLCMQDVAVQDSLPRCIRVLMHWNTDRPVEQIQHVYLGPARALRPDLVQEVDDEHEYA
ncbi:MAG TPA: chorismate mutase [Chloroflexi bacterium]|nr:chorismate mutase [Chloroflexota bacterium]